MNAIRKFILLFSGAALLAAGSVQAKEASTLQVFMESLNIELLDEVRLTLGQEFGYEDNVDERPRSQRSGNWSTETKLDLVLSRAVDTTSLGLAAGVSYAHDFHKGENDDNKGLSYYISPLVDGTYKMGRHTFMLGGSSRYESQELDRSNRTNVMTATNHIQGGWSMDLTGKTTLAVTADYKNIHYGDSKNDDYDRQLYGAKFAPYLNVSQRTRLGVLAGIERTEYVHHTLHDDSNRYTFGLYGYYTLTERTKVYAEGGAERLAYQDGTISSRNSQENYEPYLTLGASYAASDSLLLSAKLARSTEDSLASDTRGNRSEYSASFDAAWKVTGKMVITNQFAFAYQDEKAGNADENEYAYGLIVKYQATPTLRLSAGYLLTIGDYDNKVRSRRDYVDNEFRFGLSWEIL